MCKAGYWALVDGEGSRKYTGKCGDVGERSRELHGTGSALSTEEFSPGGVLVLFREMEFICML